MKARYPAINAPRLVPPSGAALREQELREEYAEQAWEMRANEIKPPSYTAWKRSLKTRRARRPTSGTASEAARGVGAMDCED